MVTEDLEENPIKNPTNRQAKKSRSKAALCGRGCLGFAVFSRNQQVYYRQF